MKQDADEKHDDLLIEKDKLCEPDGNLTEFNKFKALTENLLKLKLDSDNLENTKNKTNNRETD
jgi:hypothetical protein